MQQVAQLLALRLITLWVSCLGAGRFLLKTSQSCGGKSTNHITDRLVTTAQLPCNLARRFALGAQKKIWLLLSVNAWGDRNPVRKAARAISVKERTKRGSFMWPIFSQARTIQIPRLVMH